MSLARLCSAVDDKSGCGSQRGRDRYKLTRPDVVDYYGIIRTSATVYGTELLCLGGAEMATTCRAAVVRPGTATGVAIPSVNHVPGYGGFCPAVETQYGKTYGNATRNYYELSRQDSLSTSRKERRRSSSDSSIAVVNLTLTAPPQTPTAGQSSTVWSRPLPYALNLTGPRRDQVLHFNQSAQTYRNYYKDHSGMAVTVPNIARRRYSSAPLHRTRAFALPPLTPFQLTAAPDSAKPPSSSLTNYPSKLYQRTSSAKERAVRDVFFQKR